jgi:chitinase
MKAVIKLLLIFSLTINFTLLDQSFPYRNVMYYGESSIYSGQKNFYPSKIDANLITHLIFAFLDFNSNGDLVLVDEYADFQTVTLPELDGINFSGPYAGIFGAMSILKVKHSHLKLGVSLGGATRSGDFAEISRDKLKRQNFANNIAKFIVSVGFDFIDINLDTPNSETVKEFPRNLDESENLVLLLKEIRNELDAVQRDGRKYEITFTMPGSPEMLSKVQYDEVLKLVNFTNLITYDLNAASYSYTLHHSPLYTNKDYPTDAILDAHYSVDDTIKFLEDTYQNTIDMTKIVIGVAPYTRAWSGIKDDGFDKDNPGLYD